MPVVAKSDLSTQNSTFASYVLRSGELTFALTAPYSRANRKAGALPPLPWYDQETAYGFLNKHGMAVRAIGALLAHTRLSMLKNMHQCRRCRGTTRTWHTASSTSTAWQCAPSVRLSLDGWF